MSKAFTRESDDASADELPLVKPQVSSGAQNYITRQGADRLRQQLEVLMDGRKVCLTQSASDLNAKANLRSLESAIQTSQATLDTSIVAELPADQEKVGFGAFVTARDADGEEEIYQIVSIMEVDPIEGRISSASPLGKALLDHRAGDQVSFQCPAGERNLTIIGVHY